MEKKHEIINKVKRNDVMVTVECITYNHAPYLRQTLESIINQKCDFRFEVVIHDDASTDGSTEIIREYCSKYPDIFTAMIELENKYQRGESFHRDYFSLFQGRYIALIESDDYWPVDDKLQRQVDCLEKNKEYCSCAGYVQYFDDDGKALYVMKPSAESMNVEITYESLEKYKDAIIHIGSRMIRAEYYQDEKLLKAFEKSPRINDTVLNQYLLMQGKQFFMDGYFLYHRVQTRDDASNYNTIITYKEKFIDRMNAFYAIWYIIGWQEKIMLKWCDETVGMHFVVCMYNHDLKTFFDSLIYVPIDFRGRIIGACFYWFILVSIKHMKKLIIKDRNN